MDCSNCGYENTEDAKFCASCGQELPQPVPAEGQAPEQEWAEAPQPPVVQGQPVAPPPQQPTYAPPPEYSAPVTPGYGAVPPSGAPGYGAQPAAAYGAAPPAGYGVTPTGLPPKNHLVMSIFSTLCCCWPLGIVAIVNAASVESKWRQGDVVGAQQSSQRALTWSWIAIILGAILIAIATVFNVIAALTGHGNYYRTY